MATRNRGLTRNCGVGSTACIWRFVRRLQIVSRAEICLLTQRRIGGYCISRLEALHLTPLFGIQQLLALSSESGMPPPSSSHSTGPWKQVTLNVDTPVNCNQKGFTLEYPTRFRRRAAIYGEGQLVSVRDRP